MLKKILKSLVPPIFGMIYHKVRNHNETENQLFDGDDALFKDEVKGIYLYGEYGCGNSTKWILKNTSAKIISVDTSGEWVKVVEGDNSKSNERLNIHHSDLGDVGSWGRPKSYIRSENFSDYTDYLWNQPEKPSLVLIDGRFRVCCFLTTLKYAKEGTRILFDDYTNRPHYHFVEKYVQRSKECGRQCLFMVPSKNSIDVKDLEKDIEYFRYVMD